MNDIKNFVNLHMSIIKFTFEKKIQNISSNKVTI